MKTKLVEIIKSDDGLTYTLFSENECIELDYSEIKDLLTDNKFGVLNEEGELFVEFTIDEWKTQIMPIIKRTSSTRKSIAGDEKVLSKLLGVSGKPDSPIVNFLTKSTDKKNIYRTRIQLVNLSKWRKDKYLYNLTLPEFKEILQVCDIRFDCGCKFFVWGGLAYMATQLDSAIVKETEPNDTWKLRNGYAEPSLCKHLKGVIRLIRPNSSRILQAIKDRYSAQARARNTN